MNRAVDAEHQDPAVVVREFLLSGRARALEGESGRENRERLFVVCLRFHADAPSKRDSDGASSFGVARGEHSFLSSFLLLKTFDCDFCSLLNSGFLVRPA